MSPKASMIDSQVCAQHLRRPEEHAKYLSAGDWTWVFLPDQQVFLTTKSFVSPPPISWGRIFTDPELPGRLGHLAYKRQYWAYKHVPPCLTLFFRRGSGHETEVLYQPSYVPNPCICLFVFVIVYIPWILNRLGVFCAFTGHLWC